MWAQWIDQPAHDDPALVAWYEDGDHDSDPPDGEGWLCGVCLCIHRTQELADACHRCEVCGGEEQEETGACRRCEPLLLYRPEGGPNW